MAQEVVRLSDTHLYDTLRAELGDPIRVSLHAKRITHSGPHERVDETRPQLPRKRKK